MGAGDLEAGQTQAGRPNRSVSCGPFHTRALLGRGVFVEQHSAELDVDDIRLHKGVREVFDNYVM
jgi:hypothetical protein